MRLLLFQMPRRVSAMTIGATEHDILFRFVHRLDALVTFQTTNAFSVRFRLGLIDPVSRRQCCARDCRSWHGNRCGRTVAFLRSTKSQTPKPKEAPTSNNQRTTQDAFWILEIGISLGFGVWVVVLL